MSFKIPGFRVGKVPLTIVEAQASSRLRTDVLGALYLEGRIALMHSFDGTFKQVLFMDVCPPKDLPQKNAGFELDFLVMTSVSFEKDPLVGFQYPAFSKTFQEYLNYYHHWHEEDYEPRAVKEGPAATVAAADLVQIELTAHHEFPMSPLGTYVIPHHSFFYKADSLDQADAAYQQLATQLKDRTLMKYPVVNSLIVCPQIDGMKKAWLQNIIGLKVGDSIVVDLGFRTMEDVVAGYFLQSDNYPSCQVTLTVKDIYAARVEKQSALSPAQSTLRELEIWIEAFHSYEADLLSYWAQSLVHHLYFLTKNVYVPNAFMAEVRDVLKTFTLSAESSEELGEQNNIFAVYAQFFKAEPTQAPGKERVSSVVYWFLASVALLLGVEKASPQFQKIKAQETEADQEILQSMRGYFAQFVSSIQLSRVEMDLKWMEQVANIEHSLLLYFQRPLVESYLELRKEYLEKLNAYYRLKG